MHKFADACIYSPPDSIFIEVSGENLPAGITVEAAATLAGIVLETGEADNATAVGVPISLTCVALCIGIATAATC